MEMESSSTMALHSLLEDGDLGEMSRLGKRGVVSWKPGKGATLFISCSITCVNMLVLNASSRLIPSALWKFSTALVRSPVRVWT